MATVPYLIDNPEVGYVQTRWIFANPDESYLTKVITTNRSTATVQMLGAQICASLPGTSGQQSSMYAVFELIPTSALFNGRHYLQCMQIVWQDQSPAQDSIWGRS